MSSGLLALTGSVFAQPGVEYKTPYEVVFSYPVDQLLAPDSEPPRNEKRLESDVPHDEWYSRRVRKDCGAWGPHARHFPPPSGVKNAPSEFLRERVLAVGLKYVGLPYQHHHIPDWDPPQDWPWKQVAYGQNSKGLDCSNFSSWCYNFGLGIKFSSDVKKQALQSQIPGPGGQGFIDVRVIDNEGGYETLVSRLKTADLLFIRNKKGEIAHVIMWVGKIGKSPDGAPLVLDSTGTGNKDSNGADIPIGVNLRPFTKDSWYFRDFDHAHRIIGD